MLLFVDNLRGLSSCIVVIRGLLHIFKFLGALHYFLALLVVLYVVLKRCPCAKKSIFVKSVRLTWHFFIFDHQIASTKAQLCNVHEIVYEFIQVAWTVKKKVFSMIFLSVNFQRCDILYPKCCN